MYAVLLANLLSPLPGNAWYCEGQQCGIAMWQCCCATENNRDENCATPKIQKNGVSLCQDRCNCEMVDASNIALSSQSEKTVVPLQVLGLIHPLTHFNSTSVDEIVLCGFGTRGSPFGFVSRPPSGLRAPPTA